MTNNKKKETEDGIHLLNAQWEEMMYCLDDYSNEELSKLNFRNLANDLAWYKKSLFFYSFLQYYDDDKNLIERDIQQMGKLCRVVEEKDEERVSVDRFIPKKEYARVNRMNDEGKLYCYLASTFPDRTRKFATDTGIKEIRKEGSEHLWVANFKLTNKAYVYVRIEPFQQLTKGLITY
ncbi:hypothetical protein OBO34_11080 [Clostridiales Family XIII bacterium ASD5510]|uniref:Uncharacterized protein n=1 Tax=Hominibacterium faecale TaxID=2839743 RepID=A0A9J6QS02_9FIRM|nr:hypothetical protein [Hominibacterium faecale]MCU7378898.1 hypothetical protein [Hominibacterium faecale]